MTNTIARNRLILVAILAALQLADVISTEHALANPNVFEANPIMAWCQANISAVWWMPKVVLMGLVLASVPVLKRQWPYIALIGYYGLIVGISLLSA